MTTVLTTFMDTLETTWEAVTPSSDGSSVAFRFIDNLVEERGNGQHRQIIWGRPTRAAINSEHSIQVEWNISATLFIHRSPLNVNRTQESFHKSIAHETSDLIKAYSMVTNWGSPSILEVVLDDIDITDGADETTPKTAGGIRRSLVARCHFPFRILCIEI